MKYVALFARLLLEDDHSVLLQGVYFGDIADTFEQAEDMARGCVNFGQNRAHTILPTVKELHEECQLLDEMEAFRVHMVRKVAEMNEMSGHLDRRRRRPVAA